MCVYLCIWGSGVVRNENQNNFLCLVNLDVVE